MYKFKFKCSICFSFILKIVLVLIIMVIEPSNFPTIKPFTLLRNAVFANVCSHTMLLSRLPLAYVFSAICPNESTVAFTFIIQKLTLVLLSISPGKNALSVHFVL